MPIEAFFQAQARMTSQHTLEVDVSSQAGISPNTLEHKIKETIRQIGARLVVEEVE